MLKLFSKIDGRIVQSAELNAEDKEHVFWVDLIDPTEDEKKKIEQVFNIELFTDQESEEIELSSRYIETEEEIGINMNFTNNKHDEEFLEPVSFILKDNVLFTERDNEYVTFRATSRKVRMLKPQTGERAFLMILDTRIDYLADSIELITEKISKLTKKLVKEEKLDSDLLKEITNLQEKSMVIRENSMEMQRVLSSLNKSRIFPNDFYETITIMLKDLSSLLEHVSFNFHRLEFLQDTFQGLVDMEQNQIMKVFTIMTVIFAPATLIAGIYGMNFEYMPELDEKYAYPLALLGILISMVAPLGYFKMKKWI
ncbi:magnesium/cobalt transporter CorA [Ornithobacterium rhinotracheale]|uniref:Magnesium transport protein CorA n=1 Tax=Ornithobacterium rhinotracheale (strain ATCC 51463 / DSM 15997 / CCUG 23171 / CIP 104009 / LMG 9086) TaxID=867902 RepID=I3ZYF7_ORNRL|nr:magnesium/cobalt transporter CorA [Ornithobacterium rhinotracheale]AFL96741.1 magnesium Mg(2+) and cobalt Co(2+) transport protein CorA [Ornithobacterium rhinotracheale DSM 15997]AIP99477.1 magnesium transporter [Ornithobacterium rhinotracheale ORT-UMN 88]KGB66703.1 magnesium transporter [Ornithobacterium rhinotracheale H06-030791]MBN3662485.1 magnesium/cobalt transporter CorA [Ornithobacterium rhinotracheale]MCK0194089.1 magnesium/cobalt transporter CorA [Ornithobacterium rhinotracheale]